jgi:hypothetical protein
VEPGVPFCEVHNLVPVYSFLENLSVTPDGVPPPLSRGGLGMAENFISSPEAPLQGELAAKQTERLYEDGPAHEPQA